MKFKSKTVLVDLPELADGDYDAVAPASQNSCSEKQSGRRVQGLVSGLENRIRGEGKVRCRGVAPPHVFYGLPEAGVAESAAAVAKGRRALLFYKVFSPSVSIGWERCFSPRMRQPP